MAVSSFFECARTQSSTYASVTSILVTSSAIRNLLCWKVPMDWPNALRSLAYCRVSRRICWACATLEIAQPSRVVHRQPLFEEAAPVGGDCDVQQIVHRPWADQIEVVGERVRGRLAL